MEKKEIIPYIKAQYQSGRTDADILADLRVKLSAVYSEEEILEFLYQYPSQESQKRFKKLNIVLCVLISILIFFRVLGMLDPLVNSLKNGLTAIALVAICFSFVFLVIGILCIKGIRRFERSYYKNALALGLVMAAGAVSSIEKTFAANDPSVVKLLMILYVSVLAVAIVLDLYLIRNLWPQLTYRNKLKNTTLTQAN